MPLFDISKRINGKSTDKQLVQKSKKVKKSTTTTISGGSSLLSRITHAQKQVEHHLGKFKDRYILIQDEQILSDYIDACVKNGVISIDTETTGLDPMLDKIAGICIFTPGMKGAYIPINHVSYVTGVKVDNQLAVNVIRSYFKYLIKQSIDIIMFNAKFDIRFLRNQVGLKDIYCTWDCYLAQRLLNENEESNALKILHQKYVLEGKEDAFTFGELFKGIPFTMVPLKTAVLYAAHDPEITYEFYLYQKQFLREDNDRQDMRDIYWVFKNIEMPCVAVVADMEDNGILFDMEYQKQLTTKYNQLLEEKLQKYNKLVAVYEDEIYKYRLKHPNTKLDTPINIASPPQLAILFYDIIGYEPVDPKTPRGTGEAILSKLDDPIADVILEYRTLSKLVDTYIDKLPNCVNPNDGRIHCRFNQYGAKTGRFSSENPNLQNIPSHNKDIRKLFVASPGYVLMSSDYSQQEPKVMTQMCGDAKMLKAYQEGKDLYAQIASIAFNKPYEDCLEFNPDGSTNKEGKERRSQAKSILLGILYARGLNSIAEQLHTTKQKAQQIQDAIFKGFPAIPKFEQDSKEMALEKGYVTTLWGRKRRLPDLSLDEFEYSWVDGVAPTNDLLDFDNDEVVTDVPEHLIRMYNNKLRGAWGKDKRVIFNTAQTNGIKILDNGAKIADAERQVVNARIQGSAADMSKLAMILVGNDQRLKELGFRLLIPVHDELIGECPEENAKECAARFSQLMSEAAKSKLTVPISCDVEITRAWYGERVEL